MLQKMSFQFQIAFKGCIMLIIFFFVYLENMSKTNKGIFLQHYFYGQTLKTYLLGAI